MNRRSPVRSVLAERKMFANGGMLPISIPIQNTPSGILASSAPLIETVSREILAPMTGGARPMAEGGIAKFEQGGFASGSLGERYGFTSFPRGIETTMIPSLTPTRTFTQNPGAEALGMEWRTGVEAAYDPENPTEMSLGHLLNETAGEKVNRIFPDWAETTQTLSFDELNPGFQQAADQGEPTSRVVEGLSRGLGEARSWVQGSAEEMGQDVEAVWGYLFSGETRADGTNLGQTRAVLEMIQRRPDLEGDIKIFSRQAVSENPELSPNELSSVVAMSLSDKHEGRPNVGYAHAAADVEMDLIGQGDQGLPPGQTPPPDALIAESVVQIEDFEGATDRPPITDSPIAVAEPSEGEGEIVVAEPSEVLRGERPPSGSSSVIGTDPEDSPAAAIIETFDNPDMSPEEATKTLADYKKKFIDEMPQYEGMSESEKGWAIAEAGFKVAAGTSEHALTNIAEGLKGLGATFAKDAEEKRTWDRQVELSAVKYGLESISKDRVRLDALAKEGRVRKQFIVGKDFTDETGTFRTTGSLYLPTEAVMRTESFQTDILPNLTTEGIYQDLLTNAGALTGIVRVGEKNSPSAGDILTTLNEYTGYTKDARNAAKMMTMIDVSIVQNAAGEITGFQPWASSALNKLKNSVGMEKQLSILGGINTTTGEGLERFQHQQQVIANMMLKEILGEGSKNVSNIDRTLAGEIVGLLKGIDTIFADPDVLHSKLQHIRSIVDQNLRDNLTLMGNAEKSYARVYTAFGPDAEGNMVPGEEVSGLMGEQRKAFIGEILGTTRQATQSAEERTVEERGGALPILKASDYFNFDDMTVIRNIPTQ